MRRKPEPITRDQEFFQLILEELRAIRLWLDALAGTASGTPDEGVRCESCGRIFKDERGLRAHVRVHKE